MTREEAINILSKVTLAYEIGKVTITQREINEALDMAIKALEREPCGDCISRQAAIDAFEDTTFTKKEILRRLLELPLVTLQPKMGYWMHPYKSDIACECSECHIQIPITKDFKYCPNCGAKMEVEYKWR